MISTKIKLSVTISTRSRPKAAGLRSAAHQWRNHNFNSQPPEGGWRQNHGHGGRGQYFNSQPPEGGWLLRMMFMAWVWRFQLAAARRRLGLFTTWWDFLLDYFNSQPPKGGWLVSAA